MVRSLHLPAKDLVGFPAQPPASLKILRMLLNITIFSSIKCEGHFHPVVKENNKATKEYAIYIIKH